MKTCSHPGCSNPVFSKGLCKFHQKRTPIKKISDRRRKELSIYDRLRDEVWNEAVDSKTNHCFFCGKLMDHQEDCHHTNGRENDKLIDKYYLVNAHNDCHLFYHRATYEQLSSKPWYLPFLARLLFIDQKLWQKEIDKEFKT